MKITFRDVSYDDFHMLFEWCQNEFVYEWFEQRKLSYDEIIEKYTNKINNGIQKLFIFQCDGKDIGLVQIYKYDDYIKIDNYNNIYEYDLYIGEEDYLSRGVGTFVVNEIDNYIYNDYNADAIVLRPFSRNIRAIKCYMKCGYDKIDEYDGHDTLGNDEKITVLIRKKGM